MDLMPKCPNCGGKTDFALEIPHSLHSSTHIGVHKAIESVSHAAKANPAVGIFALAALGVAAVAARVGAKKRCERCGHTFR